MSNVKGSVRISKKDHAILMLMATVAQQKEQIDALIANQEVVNDTLAKAGLLN